MIPNFMRAARDTAMRTEYSRAPMTVATQISSRASASSSAPAAAPARSDQVAAEQVALLYSQGLASQVVALINTGLTALVLWSVAPRPALLLWIALMVLIALGRSLIVLAHRRAASPGEDVPRWRALFVGSTLASGLGWGAAGVALFPNVDLVYQVFLAYVLGGMAVGAAAVMSPVLSAYYAFLIPITLPIIVQLFARGDAMSLAMGVMFTACTGMFASSARQMHASIVESIRLRFENLELVASLSAAKETAERANESLQVEVRERVRAEAQVTASLREKEVLLTEIHHRVKNNLQVISSLLKLQSRTLSSPEVFGVFTESQNRVRSMALVHEKLYQSRDLARIDFAAYLRELASHLFRVYRTESIPLRIHAEGVHLSIERAVPCGLIASELISNALKYAFPLGRTGELTIELGIEDGALCTMRIRDDGVGLPAHVDLHQPTSLGLKIVKTLTDQIGGTIRLSNHGGASFTVVFPIEDEDGAHPAGADSHLDR